jgi:hypothetical protein
VLLVTVFAKEIFKRGVSERTALLDPELNSRDFYILSTEYNNPIAVCNLYANVKIKGCLNSLTL